MSRSSAIARLLLLTLLLTGAFSATAWILLGGIRGVGLYAWVAGPVAAAGVAAWLTLTLETGLARALGAVEEAPAQLGYTLARAFEHLESSAPRVRIFASPLPSFAVARAPIGDSRGVVFLSRGLLSHLSEPELRATLRWCALRSREGGLGLESLCAYAALCLGAGSPGGWREIAEGAVSDTGTTGLAPLGALRFLLLRPLIRPLERVGGSWPVWVPPVDFPLKPDPTGLLAQWSEHWFSAARGIRRVSETWRLRA